MQLTTQQVNSPTPTTASLQLIPSGKAGTVATLKLMGGLVKDGKKNLAVRQAAARLVHQNGQKDWVGEARDIQHFVRDQIRYVKDIRGVETLQTAEKTLEFGYGDCDDKSVLVASMLESIGHPTRFVAIGFKPDDYVHVYTETKIGPNWVGVETTEPVELGWTPPNVLTQLIYYN
jgi:transglutaminase-like putative cysteine protease